MKKLTFGSDPEFMLCKNEEICSAIDIVQGDVENRIDLKGHQFYYDNVMAECAVNPKSGKENVIASFRECLQLYSKMVNPYKLLVQASHNYSHDQLQHPKAREVGCAPDYCAYQMKLMDAPKSAIQNSDFRSCGGHIHLGHEIFCSDGPEPIIAVYLLDLFLGIPSLWIDKDPSSVARRELYGQSGRYRVKDYGIEYRSLGNFWLKSPELVSWTYDVCEFIVEFLESGKHSELWSFDEDVLYESDEPSDAFQCLRYDPCSLRNAIDTGSKSEAETHYKFATDLMPRHLSEDLKKLSENDPDFYKSWNL